jgi:hypothetical protein
VEPAHLFEALAKADGSISRRLLRDLGIADGLTAPSRAAARGGG